MLTNLLATVNERAVLISRIINLLALAGLLVVLSGSLDLQFGFGEPPCPLCLIQRSGMIGLAVGP
ncbi:MAG: disulfide bond formation protein B, partial [Actinomycetales bacterium]